MDISFLSSGILAGVYGTLACIFLTSKDRLKPYREAFGWLTLACTVEMAIDIIYYANSDSMYPKVFNIMKDMLMLPFFVMEGGTLAYQDMKEKPWAKRWKQLLVHEIPLVTMLLALFYFNGEWLVCLMAVYSACYIIHYYSKFCKRLYIYKRELDKLEKHNTRQSVTWIFIVLALNISLWVVYGISALMGFNVTNVVYCAIAVGVWLYHAYNLNNQARMHFRNLMESATLQPIEIVDVGNTGMIQSQEKQRKVMKQKKVSNDTLELFLLDFPRFHKNLQDCADSKITKKDLTLAMFICQGKKTEELADILCIGSKSVEVARSRLRSKLKMEKNQTLKKFLMQKLH